MSGVLVTISSQNIATHHMMRRDHKVILFLPDVAIPTSNNTTPTTIEIFPANKLTYNGTVVIGTKAIAPITNNHVPTIAHAHATTPANNTTTDAKSNNDVGLEKIATAATNPDIIG